MQSYISGILMPDASIMCINVMTTPWSRVRHWSAPERLQWTETEKAETSAFAAAVTRASGDDYSISNAPGCRRTQDLDIPDFHKKNTTTGNCQNREEDIFNNFLLDNDENPFLLDPFSSFNQDPTFGEDHLSDEMTSEQMEQSWFKLWLATSSVTAQEESKVTPQPGYESEILLRLSGNIAERIYLKETARLAENSSGVNNLKPDYSAASSSSYQSQYEIDEKTPYVPEKPEKKSESVFLRKHQDDFIPSSESNRFLLSGW